MAEKTSYDELPYGSYVFHYSHPDRLATMAALLGLDSPRIDQCRVLELGCGTGANLMPMACALPRSRFVGIDLSPRQIATGHDVQHKLGVTNLDLWALSILDVDASLGEFDYIICHGVFSWVPPVVQDKILDICGSHLARNGVAYISYNTYPGWHLRGMVREMMRFHVRQFSDPKTCVEQARALLDFLIEANGDPNSTYGKVLALEAEMIEDTPDTYVFHEHLEEVNHPLYFHEFVQRAGSRGLQYMAEAQPMLLPSNLSPRAVEIMERVSVDLMHGEQYLDFVRNCTFRRSLLCHQSVTLERPPRATRVFDMAITGLVKAVSAEPDLASPAQEEFQTAKGARLATNHPMLKTALVCLHEAWPRSVPFRELWDRTLTRLGPAAEMWSGKEAALADAILQCFLGDMVELHLYPTRFTLEVSERPTADPLARLQADETARIVNRRHHVVELNGLDRHLLGLLDGTRDRTTLLNDLRGAVASGELEIQRQGQPLRDSDETNAVLCAWLEPGLRHLAHSALLID